MDPDPTAPPAELADDALPAALLADAEPVPLLVVGSGIAGLSVALEHGRCVVVTAGELGAGASRAARGGVAAALAPDDSPAAHAHDTLAVASGLGDAEVAALVTAAAPERVAWLRRLGARLDTLSDGTLSLEREAGHGARRIAHAHGDATGHELMRALAVAVVEHAGVTVVEHARVLDLVRDDVGVTGVLLTDADGTRRVVLADEVVLATGGIGRAYARTTNPRGADGSGLAMAARAGATIRDPELVQFHPTALVTTDDPLPLLTEALRGAGALLLDADGRRFLLDVHPDAELAPRDVVARASYLAALRGPVHLDARAVDGDLSVRFPTVVAASATLGLDPRTDLLPVTPAAHYHMGGVATDAWGATDIPGLRACGEVAATGLHGANRLASNSLLEGLVLGQRVAAAVTRGVRPAGGTTGGGGGVLRVPAGALAAGEDDAAAIAELRDTLWRQVGIVRDDAGLRAALATVLRLGPRLRAGMVGRDLAVVAELVVRGALERRESRGSHYRTDHPLPAPPPATSTRTTLRDVVAARPLQPPRRIAS